METVMTTTPQGITRRSNNTNPESQAKWQNIDSVTLIFLSFTRDPSAYYDICFRFIWFWRVMIFFCSIPKDVRNIYVSVCVVWNTSIVWREFKVKLYIYIYVCVWSLLLKIEVYLSCFCIINRNKICNHHNFYLPHDMLIYLCLCQVQCFFHKRYSRR